MNQAGKSADLSLPKFFKAYLPDESGDDLAIPISFNSCLPKPLPRTVTVRSVYGKIWTMVLRKCEVEKYVLVNGWKRIAKDEVLKSGDFLAFEFDGSHSFNFGIYERKTMCKRIGIANDEGLDEDADHNCAEDNNGDDDDDDDAEVDGNDSVVDNDDEKIKYLDDMSNPFFPLTINPKRISQVLIPARVINDYGLNFPESITIFDPLVKKFGTLEKKIMIQMNGCVFVKGFGSIIRRNHMKAADKVICEIKKTGEHNLVQSIKIHIIRG